MSSKGLEAAAQILGDRVARRLAEVRDQQQRATTIAAADGVLIGLAATIATVSNGTARAVSLAGLIVLLGGLVAAAFSLWPRQQVSELGQVLPLSQYRELGAEHLYDSLLEATHRVVFERQAEHLVEARQPAVLAQLCLAAAGSLLLTVAAFLH